jgi:hypothetical protein
VRARRSAVWQRRLDVRSGKCPGIVTLETIGR